MNNVSLPQNLTPSLTPEAISNNLVKNSKPLTTSTVNNPIISAANPVITFMIHIKKSNRPNNIEKVRERMIHEINHFTQTLKTLGYSKKIALAARYCLCTCIDETILRTDWGTQTVWVQHTLLSYFHNETWGGERFYIILDNLAQSPRQNIATLELLYLLLSLGFEGKFFGNQGSIRDDVINKTFKLIKNTSGKQSRQLATHTQDNNAIKVIENKGRSIKWGMYILLSIFITTLLLVNIKLAQISHATINRIQKTANGAPLTTFSQLIDRSINGKDITNE